MVFEFRNWRLEVASTRRLEACATAVERKPCDYPQLDFIRVNPGESDCSFLRL